MGAQNLSLEALPLSKDKLKSRRSQRGINEKAAASWVGEEPGQGEKVEGK